ncbi:MAG: helix-turn-helix domain-containing protein [Clostridia bacterium]|nr:helix-turn-helix domain-containing protein [Clostridia bacterium]
MNAKTILKNYQKFNHLPFHIERFYPTEPINLHYHDCIELIFCTGGSCLSHIEDFCLELGRNNIFVIGGRATHTMSGFKNFEGFRILFDISMFDTLDDEVKNTSGYTSLFLLSNSGYIRHGYKCCISIIDKYYTRIVALMEELLLEYENGTFLNDKYIISLFHAICILIIKCYQDKQENPMGLFYERVIGELLESADYHTNTDAIAEKFGISGRYFRKRFTEEDDGITPSQFITDVRLRKAKSLLSCTDKSITEVAFSCGFYDSSHLIRVFKKHEGITPKEYRKRTRQS